MKLKEITKSFQIEPNILKHVFRVMKKQNKKHLELYIQKLIPEMDKAEEKARELNELTKETEEKE